MKKEPPEKREFNFNSFGLGGVLMNILAIIVITIINTPTPDVIDLTFDAVCIVESNNNPRAYNRKEGAVGVAQIRMICLRDINRIGPKKFKPKDRWSHRKSKQMFRQYITYYCKGELHAEKIARIWNGGPKGYKKQATLKYWKKVEKEMNK